METNGRPHPNWGIPLPRACVDHNLSFSIELRVGEALYWPPNILNDGIQIGQWGKHASNSPEICKQPTIIIEHNITRYWDVYDLKKIDAYHPIEFPVVGYF